MSRDNGTRKFKSVYAALYYWANRRPSDEQNISIPCSITFLGKIPGRTVVRQSIRDSWALWLDVDLVVNRQPWRVKQNICQWARGKRRLLPLVVSRRLAREMRYQGLVE